MPAPRPPRAAHRRATRARRADRAPVLAAEQLEDRDQPSATSPDLLPPTAPPSDTAALVRTAPPAPESRAAAIQAPATRHELVLIDREVPDRAALVRDLLAARPPGTAVAVVELTGGGVAEATAVLARYRGLDAVHVVSHGEPGALHLGNDRVELGSLGAFAAEFRAWGGALNAGADVLLYGCDLAAGADGRALAAGLAALTGADVAASTDLTGAAALGGDWDLEYRTGAVEAAALIDGGWAHTLSFPTGLLLATAGDVSNGGTPGVRSWTAGTVLNVAGPNFAVEPGVTGGTFSAVVDLNRFTAGDVNIDALHYVRHAVTVGGGAATMTLLPGDLLLSVNKDGATLTSRNALTVNKDEVFVFRPGAGGDYSSGTFLMLLDNFQAITGGADTWGVGLVEADTVVGDVTLRAGSFLFTRDGGAEDNDVRLFVPTGVGAGATAGTASVLVEGDDLGIAPKVYGVDLVESATDLGGRTLAAGTLLFALDAGDNSIGTNGVAATPFDVVALDVTRTTLGGGTAAGTASLLFQGADVGLATGAEAVRAFSLAAVNAAPVAADDAYATPRNTTLAVPPPGVLGNDTDADGDVLTAVLVGGPQNGTLQLNPDGSFVYDPTAGFVGADSFTYRVVDPSGATSGAATVVIQVGPPPPTAADDAYTANGTLQVDRPGGVLANDTTGVGNALGAALARGPAHGVVFLGHSGGFLYVPTPGFTGTDSFTYRATDPFSRTTPPATVTITVATPRPAEADYTVVQGQTLAVPPPGEAEYGLGATPLTAAAHGVAVVNPDGSFTYTPAPDYLGTDTFTYRLSDGSAAVVFTIGITVVPAPAPAPAPLPAGGTGGSGAGGSPAAGSSASQIPPTPANPANPTATSATVAAVALVGPAVASAPLPAADGSPPGPTPTPASGVVQQARLDANVPVFLVATPYDAPPAAVAAADVKPADLAPAGSKPPPPEAPAAPTTARASPAPAPAVGTPPAPVSETSALPAESPEEAAALVGTGLDKVSRDVGADADERAATDAVVTTAVAATAGYVLLNTRAAYWLISALLARPAVWRRFDPIDVIYSWERERELGTATGRTPEDDESLQSMVS
jgi:hypothetical protein